MGDDTQNPSQVASAAAGGAASGSGIDTGGKTYSSPGNPNQRFLIFDKFHTDEIKIKIGSIKFPPDDNLTFFSTSLGVSITSVFSLTGFYISKIQNETVFILSWSVFLASTALAVFWYRRYLKSKIIINSSKQQAIEYVDRAVTNSQEAHESPSQGKRKK